MLYISRARSVASTRFIFLCVRFYFYLLRVDFTFWFFVSNLAKRTAHPNLVFLLVRLALFQVLFSLGMLLMDELWPAVKQFLPPGADESSQPVDGGFNPLPGPSGSSDPTFFGAAGIDRDQLPSSPGDPRALPEIFDFIDSDEVEQPTAPEFADELDQPLISDEDRAHRIREAWAASHSSGCVRIVPSEETVWTIVELERRVETELRHDFSDESVLRNYASWQDVGIKNNAVYSGRGRGFMREGTYKSMLKLENIRKSGAFKRIEAAIKRNQLSFDERR